MPKLVIAVGFAALNLSGPAQAAVGPTSAPAEHHFAEPAVQTTLTTPSIPGICEAVTLQAQKRPDLKRLMSRQGSTICWSS